MSSEYINTCYKLNVVFKLMKNEPNSEEYLKKVEEFDKRFRVLVDKGGLPEQRYLSDRHYYGMGYYD